MDQGRPITAFLVTAILLWALYLWKHNRLGKPGLLPHPSEMPAPSWGPVNGPPSPGWRSGQPPTLPDAAGIPIPRF